MSRFARYLSDHPECVLQLHQVIQNELQRNLDEKLDLLERLKSASKEEFVALVRNEGFNCEECQDLIRSLRSAISRCDCMKAAEDTRDTCCGDDVIGKLFPGRRLDIITVVSSVDIPICACVLADCKFAMKRPLYCTIHDENNFEHDVAEKFDAVCEDLKNDSVSVWSRRLLLVTSEAARILKRMVNQKRLGSSHPLVCGNAYILCDVEDVAGYIGKARSSFRTAASGEMASGLVF